VTYTIYLLKRTPDAWAEALKDADEPLFEVPLVISGASRASLYGRASHTHAAPWLSALKDQPFSVEQQERLRSLVTASASAVILIEADGDVFAVPFGHGHHFLQKSACDPTFGFRVTLNAVDEQSLRSIDHGSLENPGHRTREQSPRSSSLEKFGFDFDKDLAQAVTGTPLDKTFGKSEPPRVLRRLLRLRMEPRCGNPRSFPPR
jgi:uncharacterized protein (TIGR04141 family)